jgi:phage pi2 protein 07
MQIKQKGKIRWSVCTMNTRKRDQEASGPDNFGLHKETIEYLTCRLGGFVYYL